MINIPTPAIVAIFFVTLWPAASFAIAAISGWQELARAYLSTRRFEGLCWRFQIGQFRWGYSCNVLSAGANAEGLYLAVFPPFRIGHPTLFIPWQDISVRPGLFMWGRAYNFEFRQVPSVHLLITETLGRKIQAATGSSWPG